jgi:hypothetical protein
VRLCTWQLNGQLKALSPLSCPSLPLSLSLPLPAPGDGRYGPRHGGGTGDVPAADSGRGLAAHDRAHRHELVPGGEGHCHAVGHRLLPDRARARPHPQGGSPLPSLLQTPQLRAQWVEREPVPNANPDRSLSGACECVWMTLRAPSNHRRPPSPTTLSDFNLSPQPSLSSLDHTLALATSRCR